MVDGFPANFDQVEAFEAFRKADLLLHIDCTNADIHERFNYNKDASQLEKGHEQLLDLFKHKLDNFEKSSQDVIDYYIRKGR